MTSTRPAQPQRPSDDARQVGQGALLIALGKVVFLFAGAAINFVLPRLLSKADYGNYGVVIRIVSLLNMMTVIGLLQSVSKLVSEAPAAAALTVRRATALAAMASAAVALLYAAASPLIAVALRDRGLTGLLACSAIITFGYGLYAVALGAANGLKRFRAQALLDMAFSACKVTGVLGGALLLGTLGGVAGFAAAALCLALISHAVVRRWPLGDATAPPAGAGFGRRLLLFAGAVMFYQAALNGLMSVDLLLVKRHFAGAQDAVAGVYTAAVNVAQLPYFGVLAITFVAFPLISATTFADDAATTRRYVRTAFRYGALIAVAVCAVVAASAADVLALIFPRGYGEGSAALAVLSLGYALLSLHAIGGTILNAAGKPLWSFAATAAGVAVSAAVTLGLLPGQGMLGAAIGTCCGGGVALATTLVLLRRGLGAGPDAWSSLRIAAAGALIVALGQLLPARGALLVVPASALAGLLFLAALVLLRELTREDLRVALAPFRRRGS